MITCGEQIYILNLCWAFCLSFCLSSDSLTLAPAVSWSLVRGLSVWSPRSSLLQPSLHSTHNAIILTFILQKCFENSVNCNCLTTFCDGCKFCLQNISIFATLIFAPEVFVQGWAQSSYCSDVHLSGSGGGIFGIWASIVRMSPCWAQCLIVTNIFTDVLGLQILKRGFRENIDAGFELGPIMVVTRIYVPCDRERSLGEHWVCLLSLSLKCYEVFLHL